MAITDIVQQKKEAALNNLTSSTSKTASPKVKLDPLYDTPPVGDGVTSFERVNLLIANPAELTWWDKNGNGQLDPDEPVATGGVIRDIPLALGNNTIAIVQKSAGKSVSDPTILNLYRESSLFQNTPANQYATTLQQLAIAYWGRPLTPEERQVGIDYLIKSGGNTQGVIDYLRSTPEFIAYYTSPNFLDAITKAYQTLYHRGPTASEIAAALAQPDPTLLPALLLQSENPLDQQLLAAKVLAAEQITQNYSTLLEGAQGNTLLLNEAVRAQLSQMSVVVPPGQIVTTIKDSLASGLLPSLAATLNPADDTAPVGDNTTTKQSVTIIIGNIAPGALAWWDKDGNGKFDPNTDVAVVPTNPTAGIGQITVNLQPGPNTFTFTQKIPGKDTAAIPTYLTLWNEIGNDFSLPSAPTVALRAEDDDGIPNDRVTSKSLVQLTVSGLSATREIAWVDLDGNGAFDLTKDIAIAQGGTAQSIFVPLVEGVNSFQVYQKENGITSLPGTISIYRVKDTDVITGQTAAYAGKTITLEFDRPIDWRRLDTNKDGKLDIRNLNQTSDTGELQIAWSGHGNNPPQLNNAQLAATVIDPIPGYSSRFLTITGIDITAKDSTQPIDGYITLILAGVPNVQGGVTSNVVFTIWPML